jgi:dihydropteroate synthase
VGIAHGAGIVRVHDVKEMARVARMTDAIFGRWPAGDAQGAPTRQPGLPPPSA